MDKAWENFRELVDLTNSIILRWDRHGKISFMNRFGLDFFGYAEEEIIGKKAVGLIVPRTDRAGRDLAQMISDIADHPELYLRNQNENIRRNGEHVWISWTNRAIFDENGTVSEILAIGNDHTDLKRAEDELLQSKKDLEREIAKRTYELREINERLKFELRERKIVEEAPMLANRILVRLREELRLSSAPDIRPDAMRALCRYSWPGNIRELRNVLERALMLSRGDIILPNHLGLGQMQWIPVTEKPSVPIGRSLNDVVEETERILIEDALQRAEGKKLKAAELLGISRFSLNRHMAKLDIPEKDDIAPL